MNRPELREGDILTRRYLLQERLATGGMSVIWRAFDQSLQRMVAIKVLDGSLDDENPGRELMRREARATARLIHPDAIEVYDYGETVTNGGRLASFVVMRLLEGRSLADRIMEGPLPWAEATQIAAGLAQVLAAAHDRGIVHRDVTPENVLLAADGPKLLDFGIAAFIGETDDQLVADFGTPPYVAPERLRGTTADPAVDVYALGVLLFEMLTGYLPYPEKTWEAIEAARRDGPPPVPEGVPGLPQEVADLCGAVCPAIPPTGRAPARSPRRWPRCANRRDREARAGAPPPSEPPLSAASCGSPSRGPGPRRRRRAQPGHRAAGAGHRHAVGRARQTGGRACGRPHGRTHGRTPGRSPPHGGTGRPAHR